MMIPGPEYLDKLSPNEYKILLRIDINSPIDPSTGKIIDDSRIKVHAETVKKLIDKGLAVAILAHQGRPGDPDFTTLEEHTHILSKYVGAEIKYVPDIIGPTAIDTIRRIEAGEAIMLENVRFLSEELLQNTPEELSRTHMVKRLSKLFHCYINDAFAAAHRGQTSLVGFPPVMKSLAGPVMFKEVNVFSHILERSRRPRILVVGGAKANDVIKALKKIIETKTFDIVLTAGVIGMIFHLAKKKPIGRRNFEFLERKGYIDLVPIAREIINMGPPIETPIDYVVAGSEPKTVDSDSLPDDASIMDIGEKTIDRYSELMKGSGAVVLKGPAGYIEDPRFRHGTRMLLISAIRYSDLVVIGGGHLSSIIPYNELNEKVHISTGGGALLKLFAGDSLPAIDVLRSYGYKYWM